MAITDSGAAHGRRPASQGPLVSDATSSFRLPSGSTTANRRRERSRSDTVSPCWLGLPRALRSPDAGRTPTNAAAQLLRRHVATRKRRRHARALALYAGSSRTPSPLRKTIDPANASSTLKSSAIEYIRNALRMTKIRDTSNTTKHSNPTAPQANSHLRQRADSEPNLRGTLEAVPITKHVVP